MMRNDDGGTWWPIEGFEIFGPSTPRRPTVTCILVALHSACNKFKFKFKFDYVMQ